MTSKKLLPVVLSGGIGSRLWPISREAHPKPFIKLSDGQSLLQKSYVRACSIPGADEIVTVTNRDLFFHSRDEFEELGVNLSKKTFLLEPVGRNTTAAIAIAARYALREYGADCIMLIMPADHLIHDIKAFTQAVSQAEKLVAQGRLVTFGIKPVAPETSYGYILADGHVVQNFIEKPSKKAARKYVAEDNYFWNSGIFCFRAGSFCEELELLEPDIAAQAVEAVAGAKQTSANNWQALAIQRADFEHIQSISVDYAVFEKSKNVGIVPCDIGWSDVGSWNELGEVHSADKNQNRILGNAICKQTNNCIVYGGTRLIAMLGVNDLIVSDTTDALLVAHKDHAQNVRGIVDDLAARNEPVYKEFSTVHRPWGTYTVLEQGVGFKIKRIEVKPGGRLSLQSHKHRSEHWIVVGGIALVTVGDQQKELKPNQSSYIPSGTKHRLENFGTEKLIIIEVQCGSYLGEDDIIRYDDVYFRVKSE